MTQDFLLEQYFQNKRKHKFIEEIGDDERSLLARSVMVLSYSDHKDVRTHNENYQHILNLLRRSQADNSVVPELSQLFKLNKAKVISELETEKAVLFEEIMGEKLAQYQHLVSNHSSDKQVAIEQIRQGCFKNKKSLEKVNRYNLLEKIIDAITLPHIELTADLLQANIDNSKETILLGLASVIENPRRMSFRITELEPEWSSFPLKWFSQTFTSRQLRNLFELHKNGDSLDGYVVKFVTDRLKDIKIKFDSHINPHFAQRAGVLHNCIHTFEQELFASTICTALPMIEGSIWIFAQYYNYVEGGLYLEKDGTRYLILNTGTQVKDYTVGDLLKKTALTDFFDENFIIYYCDELYNERNPILHGKDVSTFSKLNAAKKLMTFDYLTDSMNDYIQRQYFKSLDELLGTRITEKLLNREPLDEVDRKELADKTSKVTLSTGLE